MKDRVPEPAGDVTAAVLGRAGHRRQELVGPDAWFPAVTEADFAELLRWLRLPLPGAAGLRPKCRGTAGPRGQPKETMGIARVSTGKPTRLRSFDPARLADLEYRAWLGYYLRDWPQVLMSSVGLIRMGFGMDWYRTLHGSWLVLRAIQLWAPFPDNHPDRALTCMRRFYALVRLTYGEPANPARAAELEVDWWRVHREAQHAQGSTADDLVESLTRLYCYLYGEPEAELRPVAVHRARAMDLSDQWVKEGCLPDSPLLPLEHAALVRTYAALLSAVHR